MYHCEDLTFIIPIRVDSIIRIENLLLVIEVLQRLNSVIIIHECNQYNDGIIEKIVSRMKNVRYFFSESDDKVFHRTRIINQTIKYVHSPFLSVWDADVIVDIKHIYESMQKLKSGEYDVSFPYDGRFLNVDNAFRNAFRNRKSIQFLENCSNYFNNLYGNNFVGGGFIISYDKYVMAGCENEEFYGWGPEDLDRVLRWTNMKYRIHRANGPMFHLNHPRDENGVMRSEIHNSLCKFQLASSKYSSIREIVSKNFSYTL